MNTLSYSLLDYMNNLSAGTEISTCRSGNTVIHMPSEILLLSSVQSLACAVCPALAMHNNSNRNAYDVPFHICV